MQRNVIYLQTVVNKRECKALVFADSISMFMEAAVNCSRGDL